MCVLILQTPGKRLNEEDAEKLWHANPHGGGFAFVNDDEFVIQKYMSFDSFWPDYEDLWADFGDRPWLVHMRIATSGTINLDNVHPFHVNENLIGGHNGIIYVPDYKDGRSDTRVFFDDFLSVLPRDWADNMTLNAVVEEAASTSKLVFLSKEPALQDDWYILNEQKGSWEEGVWFSNRWGLETKRQSSYVANTVWDPEKKAWVPKPRQQKLGTGNSSYTTGAHSDACGCNWCLNWKDDEDTWYDSWEDRNKEAIVDAELSAEDTLEASKELAEFANLREEAGTHKQISWYKGKYFCDRCEDEISRNYLACQCADYWCVEHNVLFITCKEDHADLELTVAIMEIKDSKRRDKYFKVQSAFWEKAWFKLCIPVG